MSSDPHSHATAHGSPVLTPQVTLPNRSDIEVIRAELHHLPLLVPLFDQYRIFYEQSSDLAGAEQFLREKIQHQQSVIFLAVPAATTADADANKSTTAAGNSSATSVAMDPSITAAENASSYAVSANKPSTPIDAASISAAATSTSESSSSSLPSFALGFTQLYPSFSSVRMCRHWILNDLFVAPTSRKQGVGAILLNHARKFAEHSGAGSMQLETAVTNVTAQRLYESMKWEKVTDEFYYAQRYK